MSGDGLFRGFGRDLAASLRGSFDGIRQTREAGRAARAQRREEETPPGLVAAFSNSAIRGNQTLSVFEDHVELSTLNVLSADYERVRYGRIAGVSRRAGLSYSTLVIETRGGTRLVVKGLPNTQASAAVNLIEERLT